jgi:hypothetical protein
MAQYGKERNEMEEVKCRITGTQPILMHSDSIDWADKMEEWKLDPENKAKSKAGDDRTPPWRWMGCLYYDDPKTGVISMPTENLAKSIMQGGAQVPTGKGRGTFKSQAMSGLVFSGMTWPLMVNGKSIPMAKINEMMPLKEFRDHTRAAKELGFSLYVKRAKIGQSKHIRVRPCFSGWSIAFSVIITDDSITKPIMLKILDIAGRTKGLGDWRPSSPSPGAWGMYRAEVE